MIKRILCLLLSLALFATAAVALADEADPVEETVTAEPAPEAESPADEVPAEEAPAETPEPVLLATVNGVEIYDNDYGYTVYLDYYVDMLAQYGMVEGVEDYDKYYAIYRNAALTVAIQHVFYTEKAAELGLQPDETARAEYEQNARDYWQSAIDAYVEEVGITDDSSAEDRQAAIDEAKTVFKEQYGQTEETFIESTMQEYDYFSIQDQVMEALTKDLTISDEDIQAYFTDLVEEDKALYEGNIFQYEFSQMQGTSSFYIPEGYRGVTHILLKVDDTLLQNYQDLTARFAAEEEKAAGSEEPQESTGDTPADGDATPAPAETVEPVTQEMIEEAKQAILDSLKDKIDDIQTRFNAGTPFADLIAEYGEDPGMKMESYLKDGYAVHAESVIYDPVFTAAAMSIDHVGGISEPVIGTSGVHIIYYLRDIPSGAIELTDDIKKELTDALLEESKELLMKETIESWTKASDIQYTAEGQQIRDAAKEAEEYLNAQMTDDTAVEDAAADDAVAEEGTEPGTEAPDAPAE